MNNIINNSTIIAGFEKVGDSISSGFTAINGSSPMKYSLSALTSMSTNASAVVNQLADQCLPGEQTICTASDFVIDNAVSLPYLILGGVGALGSAYLAYKAYNKYKSKGEIPQSPVKNLPQAPANSNVPTNSDVPAKNQNIVENKDLKQAVTLLEKGGLINGIKSSLTFAKISIYSIVRTITSLAMSTLCLFTIFTAKGRSLVREYVQLTFRNIKLIGIGTCGMIVPHLGRALSNKS